MNYMPPELIEELIEILNAGKKLRATILEWLADADIVIIEDSHGTRWKRIGEPNES